MNKILSILFFLCALSLSAQTPVQQARPAGIRDGINYQANGSVILSLFAPYKNSVYVLGDFNNWTSSPAYLMKKDVVDNDHVYWWLEITGLNSTTEYAFQYLIDGSLRLADPYTEKILDPTHDAWIDPATYPNLKSYPAGQSEIASVLFPSQTNYTYQNTVAFTRPAKEKLTIYELHLRDFIGTHRFNTLSDTLTYLKKLGINAIELMPLNEFEGNSSWGYNPSFYFAVDKYYGPADQLKRFIDKCHGEGIAVIIDLVMNHSYNASPLVRMYFDGTNPTAQNPWYNSSCVSAYCWGNDFNHTSSATQYFVDRVAEHWLKNYHFDGIRFDFTQGFTQTAGDNWPKDDSRIAIIKRLSNKIWETDPNAYVILEHWTDNSEEIILADHGCMLWGNVTEAYQDAALGEHANAASDFSWGYFGSRNWQKPHLITYMESHDEERIMYRNLMVGHSDGSSYDIKSLPTALDRSALSAAFLFTVPGPKMIWQFQELGYDYSINYNQRVGEKPIRWDYLNDANRKDLYDEYSKLIKLRLAHEVFTSAQTNVSLALNNSNGLKKIMLLHASMNAVVIGNFGVTTASINPAFPSAGVWYDALGNENISYNGTESISIILAPGAYRIYTSRDTKNSSPYLHAHTSMYAAGTFNDWNTSSHPMQLIADHTWQISGVTFTADSYAIKFTNASNWTGQDWGNAVGLSGNASLTTGGGANIQFTIPTNGIYTVRFNENTLNYTIVEEVLTSNQNLNAIQHQPFSVSPHPASGDFFNVINSDEIAITDIHILDATGKVILNKQIDSTAPVIEIPNTIPSGLYLLVIQNKERTYRLHLMKN